MGRLVNESQVRETSLLWRMGHDRMLSASADARAVGEPLERAILTASRESPP
jgi:hypothetical protein